MSLLIIDNYDSFTFNLYQYFGELGVDAKVVRNNEISLEDVRRLAPKKIVISPGPGHPAKPEYFGVCAEVISQLSPQTPVLGICLGHQGLAHVFGGQVVRAQRVMHGKTSQIIHKGDQLFAHVPSPFEAMRYHSLIVKRASLPSCLEIIAETNDGLIMGLKHKQHPLWGIQFHPESIGTQFGLQILRNFLNLTTV
ncbi:MAG: aminodeoxychorismate/anthranilate synthase component II [Myxococcota bacterium]|nr:aminodeoxychorismate/anthranilate synthase component II [Myxococcota bacterium]